MAEWHGLIEPDLFGVLLAHLGKYYNMAWLVPERNNHGLTTITKIVELSYPRIYAEMVLVPPVKPSKRLGWLTTKTSKELIINNLIAEIRDDCHGIVCREVWQEMLTFIRTAGGQYRAENSMHDDRVMAMAIGKFVVSKLPPVIHPTTGKALSPEAWT
ncbi:bacteriophage terminase large subunit [Candidatus Magnetobacterium bavaricum]|uniref:Bacteriophage terminase large subunit n=1 Tax=Candidatus Magnetobacterium bavaricum TaxID=29290 RepID=A0A0F3GPH8_9BACT|nr:bacteriophage terminase large subunit [Candidatus Magnetobacterium bavaricum]